LKESLGIVPENSAPQERGIHITPKAQPNWHHPCVDRPCFDAGKTVKENKTKKRGLL